MLKERLQRLPGVGSVFIGAERRYAMRVWLDPQRHGGARPHAGRRRDARSHRGNAEIPAGRVEGPEREFSVRTRGDLSTAEEFAAIIVAQTRRPDGAARRRRQGRRSAPRTSARVARYNGQPAIGLGIVKQSKASTVDVADEVSKALPELPEARCRTA